ncbi:MAG: hypothetical protein Q8M20_14760 [Rhodocyclaceae bacterium]|nr:hypothetical protein [Rhodocyclaceae bacterium]MDZ4216261.1 hypothetical protein [Rhodocyclaceae bacterium]
MVIVMDMSTGKTEKLPIEVETEEEFGPFVDEVLNAGWMPQPVARLEPRPHAVDALRPTTAGKEIDTEEFLSNLYRHQE